MYSRLALLLPFAWFTLADREIYCNVQGRFDGGKGAKVSKTDNISADACQKLCANNPFCRSMSYDSDDECIHYPLQVEAKGYSKSPTGNYRVWDRDCPDIKRYQPKGELCTVTMDPAHGFTPDPTCAPAPVGTRLASVLADPDLFSERTSAVHCSAPGHLMYDAELFSDEVDDEMACAASCLFRQGCESYSIRFGMHWHVHCKGYAKTIETQHFKADGSATHMYYDRVCPLVAIVRNDNYKYQMSVRPGMNATATAYVAVPSRATDQTSFITTTRRRVTSPTRSPDAEQSPDAEEMCNKVGYPRDREALFRAQVDVPTLPSAMVKDYCHESCTRNTTCKAYAWAATPGTPKAAIAICAHLPQSMSELEFREDMSANLTYSDHSCPV